MSRARGKLCLTVAPVCAGVGQLLATILVLVTLAFCGAHRFTAPARLIGHVAPSLHAGSTPRVLDAVAPRLDASLQRVRLWLDLPLVPGLRPPRVARFASAWGDVPALGPGHFRPRDLSLSHFRRRIPRMNSEDPPCG
jgi:hypothetical protein